jgi:hypothetical protein
MTWIKRLASALIAMIALGVIAYGGVPTAEATQFGCVGSVGQHCCYCDDTNDCYQSGGGTYWSCTASACGPPGCIT